MKTKNRITIASLWKDCSWTFAADTFSEIITFPNPKTNPDFTVIASPGNNS